MPKPQLRTSSALACRAIFPRSRRQARSRRPPSSGCAVQRPHCRRLSCGERERSSERHIQCPGPQEGHSYRCRNIKHSTVQHKSPTIRIIGPATRLSKVVFPQPCWRVGVEASTLRNKLLKGVLRVCWSWPHLQDSRGAGVIWNYLRR
jgi:hypothetical protein